MEGEWSFDEGDQGQGASSQPFLPKPTILPTSARSHHAIMMMMMMKMKPLSAIWYIIYVWPTTNDGERARELEISHQPAGLF